MFTPDDILVAVKACNADKAVGPDLFDLKLLKPNLDVEVPDSEDPIKFMESFEKEQLSY